MIGLLKRYREIILVALLLVSPLGVYFAHAKHPSERSKLDKVILKATWPIERAIAWTIGGALGAWNGYIGLRGAHQRALDLQHEVTSLRLEHAELQQLRAENDRLEKLLTFARESPERRVVGARVIGVRLDPKGLQLVTVDRGSRQGVERLMPVVVGHGVVGRVHAVSETSADVLLITDRNSSIAVRVDRTRARANVRGTGSPDAAKLEYALRSDDMQDGDVLVTSGTDGIFPRGLPVGTVAGLKKRGQGLYQRAEVKPAVDVTKLDEVLVMLQAEKLPDEPVALAPAVPAPAATATPPRAAKPAPISAEVAGAPARPKAPRPAPARSAEPTTAAATPARAEPTP